MRAQLSDFAALIDTDRQLLSDRGFYVARAFEANQGEPISWNGVAGAARQRADERVGAEAAVELRTAQLFDVLAGRESEVYLDPRTMYGHVVDLLADGLAVITRRDASLVRSAAACIGHTVALNNGSGEFHASDLAEVHVASQPSSFQGPVL